MELKRYAEIAYEQFGGLALDVVPYFQDFNMTLNKANIKLSLPEYIALAIASVFLSFGFMFAMFGTIFVLGSGLSGLVSALMLSIVVSGIVAALAYVIPLLKVNNRATVIRDMLPFAVMYLSTLAGTGSSISEMFENLAKVDEYGEVSEEAKKIHRDIDTFGMDVNEALRRGAQRTPSEDFEELLRGMEHILTTGGSVREFLRERAAKLMDDYERRIEKFADQLGLLVEMYITIVVVGSIIFTAMSAIMSSFTGFAPGFIVALQAILIFIGLPLISGMFILFIKGIAPGGIM
ncbi:type II secretion system F family protein [Candidatus Nanosalina sp. VS9-1]|uniref:type II secretion system F family protein n=1 Tax=Candidatus Nanosalina sp. VS9-1 TaxID=3388566 RepID=UPI0039E00B7C